jgi:hypothetical protein
MTRAEEAVRDAARRLPEELRASAAAAEGLRSADRSKILDNADRALADFRSPSKDKSPTGDPAAGSGA